MTTLKARLAARDLLIGTFVKTPHPSVVEALGSTRLDLLALDAEHAPFDRGDLDACLLAARATGVPALVRVPEASPAHILNALDLGATGVLAPHVRNAENARALALASQYGPGGRGYAGSTRAAGYGQVGMGDHLAAARETICVVAQIEDCEALDEIDEIAATPGVDALFIGRIDLTVALGAESPNAPEVVAAMERIIAACRAAGRTIGLFTADPAELPRWIALGATLFLLSSDHGFMRAGANALVAQSKPSS